MKLFDFKKIEVDEPEIIKDMVSDKSKLLRGPRHWFRENVVKPYEIKFGKPALNYLTNGNYASNYKVYIDGNVGTQTNGVGLTYHHAEVPKLHVALHQRSTTRGAVSRQLRLIFLHFLQC